MTDFYDIFEYISQREEREMPKENERLVFIANVIRAATENCRGDESKSKDGTIDVAELHELEKREAEKWAKS